jgi:hypothetical protein
LKNPKITTAPNPAKYAMSTYVNMKTIAIAIRIGKETMGLKNQKN